MPIVTDVQSAHLMPSNIHMYMHLVPIIKKTLLSMYNLTFWFCMSLTCDNLPLQLSTSSSDTHSSLVPAKKNKKSFYHCVEWENEKKIEATNCNSCRPLQNEQNKMNKKTYPEKHCREKCKWQYAADQRTFNKTWKPYARLS